MEHFSFVTSKKFVIILHFRNPFLNNGGSENIILQHYYELTRKGYSCYILFPVIRAIGTRNIRGWGFLYGKQFVNVYSIEKLLSILNTLNNHGGCKGIFVHSLINADIEEVRRILSIRQRICIYIHDYSMCCTRYTLMKNDEYYCGDATITDNKCYDCIYYASAVLLRRSIRYLLMDIEDLVLIAPSVSVYQLWGESFPEFKDRIHVVPHYSLVGEYIENMDPIQEAEPLKIAFVGKSMHEKGIDLWLDSTMCVHNQDKSNITFYHFGNMNYQSEFINYEPVDLLDDGWNGMQKKLRERRIHACALISSIPETYSLTYYECLAANCFVITTSQSGNISTEVEKRKNGIVIPYSADALTDLLKDEIKLRKIINEFRAQKKYGPEKTEINCKFIEYLNNEKSYSVPTSFQPKRAIQAWCANIYYKKNYSNGNSSESEKKDCKMSKNT